MIPLFRVKHKDLFLWGHCWILKDCDVCRDNKMLKSTNWFDQILDLVAASTCIPRGTGRLSAVAGIITDPSPCVCCEVSAIIIGITDSVWLWRLSSTEEGLGTCKDRCWSGEGEIALRTFECAACTGLSVDIVCYSCDKTVCVTVLVICDNCSVESSTVLGAFPLVILGRFLSSVSATSVVCLFLNAPCLKSKQKYLWTYGY